MAATGSIRIVPARISSATGACEVSPSTTAR